MPGDKYISEFGQYSLRKDLVPVCHQAITQSIVNLLSVEPLRIKFNEIYKIYLSRRMQYHFRLLCTGFEVVYPSRPETGLFQENRVQHHGC